MPTSRMQNRVLETYARSLLEAAKDSDHVFSDLNELEVLSAASSEVLAVVGTLSERGQLDLLPRITELYRSMTEEDEEVVGVRVTTAIPLDDELRASISARCERELGRKVFLIEQVDPDIIGGIVLEALGERRDISVRTQLRAARSVLGGGAPTNGGDTDHA